ncbi:hypothetical protein IDH44_14650 [Paenibacillus sp. IB182496]|uniref:Uncharacterized protein n=2 Tax=Paenibacillus sabuli TaxID=2772509 RepID=A0A927GSD2_9BACL|nr:hypothetical protein [Paenibacillus sabuli]
MDLGRYGSREVLKLQMFDATTEKPLMYFDYANTVSQAWAATRVYANGAGARRMAWDGDKQETLTVETQVFTMQHLALLAGEEIKSGAANIYRSEILTVIDGGSGAKTVQLSKPAIGGAEAVSVFAYVNGVLAEPQDIETVTGSDVELATSATVAIGDEVEVYYQFQSAASHTLQFTAKGFPKYVKLVGDTLYQDEVSGEAVAAQITYYKAKLQPNFTLAMSSSGDPASVSLVFDLFAHKLDGVDVTSELVLYEE